ncbi:MAG: hypothetical protein IJ418_17000 [Clostridia bacterium]|nr:hypothetical protein [Clostridia bacterium]
MKKSILILIALLLTLICTVAFAQEYVTLAQLREQAAQGWNKTYEAKGREVVADVKMGWFPEADACPLVRVDPYEIDPDDERVDKWRELPHSIIYDDLPDRIVLEVRNHKKFDLVPLGSWNGKWLEDHFHYYDGEFPDREAEDCDIDFKAFMMKFEADMLEFTGLALDDVHIEEIWVSNPGYKGKKVNGEYVRGDKLTAAGGYLVDVHQLVHGVPVLGSRDANDKGRIQLSYHMYDYCSLLIWSVANPVIIEEDLPLLSFDAFKDKLEELIDAGKLRGVDAMRFGYGTCKDGKEWKLVPVWIVTGGYTDDPNSDKNVMAYVDKDGDVCWPMGYREYYFNAQTGEMMEQYAVSAREDSLRMPEILNWSDVE